MMLIHRIGLFLFLLSMGGVDAFTFSQVESTPNNARIIRAERPSDGHFYDEDDEPLVQVLSVSVGNVPVELNTAFVSDNNWLRDLRIRIKNISTRDLYCVGVAFGLLADIDTRLKSHESWPWGIGFYKGSCGVASGRDAKLRLRPGREITLDFDDVPRWYTGSMDKMGLLKKAVLHRQAYVGLSRRKDPEERPLSFSRYTKFIDQEAY